MSRTHRFLGGLGYGYAFQAIVILAGLGLPPFFLRHLGKESYGLWLVGLQITTMLALLDFGLTSLLPREFAARAAKEGEESVSWLAGHALQLLLVQMPIVAIAAFCVWYWLPPSLQPLRGIAAWLLGSFVVLFPLRILPAFLQGMQDLAAQGRFQMISWAVGTLTTIGLILANWGMRALPVGWAVQQLVVAGLSAWRWRVAFPQFWPEGVFRWNAKLIRRLLSQSIWLSAAQVATTLLQGSDLLLIGWILGPAPTVIYSCTTKIVSVLANQPQMLLSSALPGLSELRVSGDRPRLIRATTALRDGMLLLSGAVVCIVATVNRGFVGWWVGPQYFGGALLTLAAACAMMLRHWNSTLALAMFSLGMERRLFLTLLADGALTLTLSVALLPRVGLPGVALASILGAVLISIPANTLAVSRSLDLRIGEYLAGTFPWLGRLAVVLAALYSFPFSRAPIGPIWLAGLAGAVTAAYGIIFVPNALRGPLGGYVRPLLSR